MIWLASYPRSGNTLLRTILNSCFGIASYHDEPMIWKWEDTELLTEIGFAGVWDRLEVDSGSAPETHLVKTHYSPSDSSSAIYIVRDPRFVTESFFHYHKAEGCPRSIRELILGAEYYGDWSNHVMRWTSRSAPTLVLRYEDLANPSSKTLASIASFIGYSGTINEWNVSFAELHRRDPDMFRKGFIREWTRPEHWSEIDEALLLALHGPTMVRMGYADSRDIGEAIAALDKEVFHIATMALEANRKHYELRAIARAEEVMIREAVARFKAMNNSSTTVSRNPGYTGNVVLQETPVSALSDSSDLVRLQAEIMVRKDRILELERTIRDYRKVLAPIGPLLRIANRVRACIERIFSR